ncbi:integrase core domain-containing protein [Streptomyces sp. NPDC004752]
MVHGDAPPGMDLRQRCQGPVHSLFAQSGPSTPGSLRSRLAPTRAQAKAGEGRRTSGPGGGLCDGGGTGQYVSIRCTERLSGIGASASAGSVADSYDNAVAEALLNGTFKAELIEMQGPWKDFDQVERAIFQWVTWYNEERLRSALDNVPPAGYERDFWRSQDQVPQSA